ncbi:MAG TPA: sulfite exporter TauE/SafE family protein [Actinomycetota bacterium]|nr:sulfite exporter TauE/SafE family protein [Actinomycetota bacterium]
MTLVELAAASAVCALGATVQGSLGFGLNLVAVPVLVAIDPGLVPGPALVAALVLTILIAHRERATIDLFGVRWAFVGRVPGTLAGGAAVSLLPERDLVVILAAMVLLGVAMSAGGWSVEPTLPTLLGAGALSGLMGTVSSIGGPPMALLYQRRTGADIRGTLSGFFVVGASLSLVTLAVVGRFGPEQVKASAALIPGLLVGFAVSSRTKAALDKGWTRPAVLGLCAVSAVAVLVRQIL